jgi:hypothetical protein
MDIVAEVAQFRGVAPLLGLDNAWTWTIPGGEVRLALALSEEGGHAFQLNCRNGYSTDLAAALLRFARANDRRLASASPMATAEGFSAPGTRFDCVISILPSVVKLHKTDLGAVTYAVFPGWRCEVSGDESEDEAFTRYKKFIRPWDYKRSPQPFIRMRYQIAEQRPVEGRAGGRALVDLDRLYRELASITELGDGWIECENFLGEVVLIEWTSHRVRLVDLKSQSQEEMLPEAVTPWLGRFLHSGSGK